MSDTLFDGRPIRILTVVDWYRKAGNSMAVLVSVDVAYGHDPTQYKMTIGE